MSLRDHPVAMMEWTGRATVIGREHLLGWFAPFRTAPPGARSEV
ncbi:MAG: hypothetical protein WB471_05550 [Nocardioides sp.]